MASPQKQLTRNQALVFGLLERTANPLSAYDILDRLRDQGLRAPAQIYRALETLIRQGRIHRLESLNAYMACRHNHGPPVVGANGHHNLVAFWICNACGDVQELENDTRMVDRLQQLVPQQFSVDSMNLELRGLCHRCTQSRPGSEKRDSAGGTPPSSATDTPGS